MIENDRRYRVMVVLERTDKPLNITWKCPFCGQQLANLVNGYPQVVTDVIDMDDTDKSLVGVRCSGRTYSGRCNTWWYFSIRQPKSDNNEV